MARIKIDGDASGLVAAQRKARDSARELDDEFKKIATTNKQLERQVKRTWEEARSPLERYNERVKRLHQLEKEGAISKQQLQLSLTRLKEGYERAEVAQQNMFGRRGIGMLKNYLENLNAVEMGVNFVRNAFVSLNQERAQLAGKLRTEAEALARFVQIADTPVELDQLIAQQREMKAAGAGGVASADAIFQLESGEINTPENRRIATRIMRMGAIDKPVEAIAGATTLMNNFENLTLGKALSIVQAASATTKVGIAEMQKGLTEAAEPAGRLGLSPSDLAAFVAMLTDLMKNGERAGAAANSFFQQVDRSQLGDYDVRGRSSQEILDNIQRHLDAGVPIQKILGEQVAQSAAINALRKRDEMAANQGDIQAAGQREEINRRLDMGEANQRLSAEIRARVAEGAMEVQREPEALRQIDTDRVIAERLQMIRDRGADPVQQYAGRTAAEGAQAFGLGEQGIGVAAEVGTELFSIANPLALYRTMVNSLQQIEANTRPASTVTLPE